MESTSEAQPLVSVTKVGLDPRPSEDELMHDRKCSVADMWQHQRLRAVALLLSLVAIGLSAFLLTSRPLRSGVHGEPQKIELETTELGLAASLSSPSAIVAELRQKSWPLDGKGSAPTINHITYINLESEAGRRKYMETQLNDLVEQPDCGFTVARFGAITKLQAVKDDRFSAFRARGFNPVHYPNVQNAWGTAACEFSHFTSVQNVSRHASQLIADHAVMLIMEDDIDIPIDIQAKWNEIWPYLPWEWDIVKLGSWGSKTSGWINERIHATLWSDDPPSGPCYYCGNYGYIVNPKRVDRVLHRFRTSMMNHPDCLFCMPTPPNEDVVAVPPLLSFAAEPPIFSEGVDENGLSKFMTSIDNSAL